VHLRPEGLREKLAKQERTTAADRLAGGSLPALHARERHLHALPRVPQTRRPPRSSSYCRRVSLLSWAKQLDDWADARMRSKVGLGLLGPNPSPPTGHLRLAPLGGLLLAGLAVASVVGHPDRGGLALSVAVMTGLSFVRHDPTHHTWPILGRWRRYWLALFVVELMLLGVSHA